MNKSVFVSCGDREWNGRTGETAEILHRLTADKVDDEVGPMFRIRFADGVETDAFLDELPDLKEYLFGEVVYDIASCIPVFTGKGKPAEDCWYDSRDLYACIYGWAKEFERKHPNPSFDYMSLVEEFAYEKLKEFFDMEGER